MRVKSLAKIKKDFRLEVETIQMMDTMIPFVSAEKNIKMDRTKLIEMLITERYKAMFDNSRNEFLSEK